MTTFRTRARTVDLLGRQQIAGLPTAIHELFKNAHDAYADHVEVDYFREDRLLVLRDDGVGMTREEFEKRWLVIGTESKVDGGHAMAAPPRDDHKSVRPVLGEKGIGRLAVGIVGESLLVLTRAVRDGVPQSLVAAFIHWELFSLPGIDLDQIHVPIREIEATDIVDARLVRDLVTELEESIRKQGDNQVIPKVVVTRICAKLRKFRFDPARIESHLPGPDSLRISGGNRGTQFWIVPANSQIDNDLDSSSEGKVSPMQIQLMGFSDTMTPSSQEPVVSIAFRDHRSDTDIRDVLSRREFFTPNEFRNADHYITGHVDSHGEFKGDVSVFGEVHSNYALPFHGRNGGPVACGPFDISLAVIQGERRESTLPDEDWRDFFHKSSRFGGIYVYLDGIRVLPYGRPEVDWLEIEERRSRSAGYYFFSHRRMVGAVLLRRDVNADIQEKAGREGFIHNSAYRDLIDVIKSILIRLAAEFFRQDGVRSEQYYTTKSSNEAQFRAREKRSKSVNEKKKQLAADLERVYQLLDSGSVVTRVEDIERRYASQIESVISRKSGDSTAYLYEMEREARTAVEVLRSEYAISLPRIGLSKDQDRRVRLYRSLKDDVETRFVAPMQQRVRDLFSAALELTTNDAKRYQRLLSEIQTESTAAMTRFDGDAVEVKKALHDGFQIVSNGIVVRRQELHTSLQRIESELPRRQEVLSTDATHSQLRDQLLGQITTTRSHSMDELVRMKLQLQALSWDAAGDILEQLTAAEQRNEDLLARQEEELEVTQIGLAVEIISHEFEHNIEGIRDQIRELKSWADGTPRLVPLYRGLRASFEHLDAYLTLLTPLSRRLYRSKIEFSGSDIEAFLRRLFRQKLEESGVELAVTKSFQRAKLYGYPSTYYPVLLNLVDNAIWWTKDRSRPRVTLDAQEGLLFVRDNGLGVRPEDREFIFQPRVSLKPGGRGLGLAISRDALRVVGGDLALIESEVGAVFCITLPKEGREDETSGGPIGD